MSDIPRDPSAYHPTVHCIDRHKKRGIDLPDIAATIQTGEIKDSHEPGCSLFVKEFEYYPKPIGVVANTQTGEIVTVEYRGE